MKRVKSIIIAGNGINCEMEMAMPVGWPVQTLQTLFTCMTSSQEK